MVRVTRAILFSLAVKLQTDRERLDRNRVLEYTVNYQAIKTTQPFLKYSSEPRVKASGFFFQAFIVAHMVLK